MTWIYNKRQYTLHIKGFCAMQGNPKNDCNWMELQSENEALEMDGVAAHKCKVCQNRLEKIINKKYK